MCVWRVVVPRKCNDVSLRVGSANYLPFVLQAKTLPVFVDVIPFVTFDKITESVTNLVRNCPRKMQTATTGRQPVELQVASE